MCLSNVYIDSNGQPQEVMRDVARMEDHDDVFLLTGLLVEQKFIPGEVRAIDFGDKHPAVLGVHIAKYEQVSDVSF